MREISAFESIKNGFDFDYILGLIMGIIPALLCITLHELSHGYVAWKLGDNTARRMGRLTLNPIKHIDIMGLLTMLVFHVGWAKPVPVNMNNFKNPKKGMAITALAGPVSNVIICMVFLLLFGALYVPLQGSKAGLYVLEMLRLTSYLSLGLGIFNFIPLPPLDGSKVLLSFLSNEHYYKLMRYERYGMIVMFILVFTGILGRPLSMLIDSIYGWFFPMAQWACDLVVKIFYI